MTDEILVGELMPSTSTQAVAFFEGVAREAGLSLSVKPSSYQSRLNPAQAYILRLESKQSRGVMQNTLNMVSQFLWEAGWAAAPWHLLDRDLVLGLQAVMNDAQYAPATINRYLAAIRAVAKEAWLGGTMDDHRYRGIAELKGAKGTRLRGKGRLITNQEIQRLMSVNRGDSHKLMDYRDRAIVALMLTTGLRKSEVCGLKTKDMKLDEGYFTVIGKGNKEALIRLTRESRPVLAAWFDQKDRETTYVFNSISRGRRLLDRPISAAGITHILRTVAKAAGIPKFAPHDTRRTYATNLFAAGHDPLTVRDMMRHASVETTEIYNIKDDEKQKAIAEAFQILSPL